MRLEIPRFFLLKTGAEKGISLAFLFMRFLCKPRVLFQLEKALSFPADKGYSSFDVGRTKKPPSLKAHNNESKKATKKRS